MFGSHRRESTVVRDARVIASELGLFLTARYIPCETNKHAFILFESEHNKYFKVIELVIYMRMTEEKKNELQLLKYLKKLKDVWHILNDI